jgi:pimeloyl-ACP methyl ester carboxylesterase
MSTNMQYPSKQPLYAPINGLDLYYEIHGEGQPLVLIHGGGSTIQTSFARILPSLAKYFKVIAVELQAHGHTKDRDAPESFTQDAADVKELLNYLKINKAHIMGFSNGGQTAMQIGISYPAVVDKLVIISAFYKREGAIPGFFDGFGEVTIDMMPAYLKDAYLEIGDANGLQRMFEKDKNRMAEFTGWNDDEISSIKASSLIIAGDKDVVTPEHAVEMSRRIQNSELLIVPGDHGSFMGEGLSVDTKSKIPEMVVEVVREFLLKG